MTNNLSVREVTMDSGDPSSSRDEGGIVQQEATQHEEEMTPRRPRMPHQSPPLQEEPAEPALETDVVEDVQARGVEKPGTEDQHHEDLDGLRRMMIEMQCRLDAQQKSMEALSLAIEVRVAEDMYG
ncbi:hypothetical protein Pmar_PMAR000431 [Perkinsus marinus ATCC 50983]|uniref:Uncharacterized protein n=1 Tax=Perkinsus marinus (strain ATCC 50983 / TXsc) TaxID=423536 RepID=C5L4F4_PERM5|nr:hypothetical protein Pmar_PMAR000431 [Perkinsus marinus ATCC 50983]EER08391.1 hypothetical protein Pmar_PMAR000431 [Perkinsus marinus ATCC 50983]|eukprot:XP_002776575.1 hypothetical protein Pmar_PMAR000431 [Perkinsus marinus ATCC 50983]